MTAETLLASYWLVAIALNSFLIAIAFALPKKLLTPAGYLHAWILGVLVWGCLGWRGYAIVMFYFLVGSGVTKIGMKQKEAEGIAEKRGGMRGPENVWGSALVGTLCAIAFAVSGNAGSMASANAIGQLCLLGYAASFATKLSDTTASEVGKAYGKRTFLITTLQPVPRGTEGAVSLEGTLAGVVGSLAIAAVAVAVGAIDGVGVLWCAIAAFVATNAESVIGATVQEQFDWLTNEVVNGINTAIGAVVAIGLGWLLSS
ncbi:MAG: TIGR00297 family protein [Geitlerinemataceae cyanobacterium]